MSTAIFLLFLITYVHSKLLPDIYWNSTNSIFDVSNTDHVIPVSIGDTVSLVCPKPGKNYQFTRVYRVKEEEYDNCLLNESYNDSNMVGACNNDSQPVNIKVVFRNFSPIPNALEYQAGNSYFFITTSDGSHDGIDQRQGGLCQSHQMKIRFDVRKHGSAHLSHHNPKFAASTFIREEESTPVMYIIHTNGEPDPLDEDSTSMNSLNVCWLTVFFYLLFIR